MSPRAQTGLLRAWRLAALALAALLLQRATPPRETALTRLTLADVQAFFPQARQFKPGPQETLLAQDEYGNRVGRLLTTYPDAEAIIGYSGPTNVLVALDNQERIVGTRILASDDTPDHVDRLRGNAAFERGFKDWRPTSQPAPRLEGYAGSTLTALAIEESIQKRLSGNYASLRFPTPLKLEEIKALGFPAATGFEPNTPRLGWNLVRGAGDGHLGYVVRTSPSGDEVNGYAGPTDTLIALAPDGLTLRQVVIRETYDTTDYVDRVRTDDEYLKLLTRWSAREWATLDFGKARLEGVAGATLTSYAMAEGIKRRFADDAQKSGADARRRAEQAQGTALWLFLVGGLVMTFSPWHGRPALRLTWQLLLVGGLGLWLGQLLSLSLLAGWARHGLGWGQTTGLAALGAIALLVPWGARRQPYCHHLCPHGAAQELLGRARRLHLNVPSRWHARLSVLPFILLAAAFLTALAWPGLNLGRWEPFDAWALGAATTIPLTLAALSLVTAPFVPQGFCKYACPTGALLKLMRTPSERDRWSIRDSGAALVLVLGFGLTAAFPTQNLHLAAASEAPITEIHGGAFGTTWTVKLRGASIDRDVLNREIEAELNRLEFSLSHWRPSSATSEFNRADTTAPVGVTPELLELLGFARTLSRKTRGAYDVTIAPLADAWSFGPAGRRTAPTDAELAAILPQVGWEKLTLDVDRAMLSKAHPRLQIDLGSVLQGYADDRVAAILRQHGQTDFLIEIGGELLASGSWHVGIEDPFNPRKLLAKVVLKDTCLSPSGLYRAKRLEAGKPVSHILSPLTGRPVEPTIELCCVWDKVGLHADGWATALMALGWEEAKRVAEQEGLAVWLVSPRGEVWKSSRSEK
jgi:NosR/NirI family nitrous oxide reductase transcriptional regulator